jgi:hypothetical protein
MINKGTVKTVLSLKDLSGFTEQELALVYVGQDRREENMRLSYYDAKYYDAKYYDAKYYDAKYYDARYSERSTWGHPYTDDPTGPHYNDSSYSDTAC